MSKSRVGILLPAEYPLPSNDDDGELGCIPMEISEEDTPSGLGLDADEFVCTQIQTDGGNNDFFGNGKTVQNRKIVHAKRSNRRNKNRNGQNAFNQSTLGIPHHQSHQSVSTTPMMFNNETNQFQMPNQQPYPSDQPRSLLDLWGQNKN